MSWSPAPGRSAVPDRQPCRITEITPLSDRDLPTGSIIRFCEFVQRIVTGRMADDVISAGGYRRRDVQDGHRGVRPARVERGNHLIPERDIARVNLAVPGEKKSGDRAFREGPAVVRSGVGHGYRRSSIGGSRNAERGDPQVGANPNEPRTGIIVFDLLRGV